MLLEFNLAENSCCVRSFHRGVFGFVGGRNFCLFACLLDFAVSQGSRRASCWHWCTVLRMVTHDEEEYMGNTMVGEKLFLYIYDGTALDKNAVSSLKILFYFHTKKTSGKYFTTKNWDWVKFQRLSVNFVQPLYSAEGKYERGGRERDSICTTRDCSFCKKGWSQKESIFQSEIEESWSISQKQTSQLKSTFHIS